MKKGDPVTALVLARGGLKGNQVTLVLGYSVVYSYVHTVQQSTFVTDHGATHLVESEGIWWIRGHHAEDSPEVAALLAANAFTRT